MRGIEPLCRRLEDSAHHRACPGTHVYQRMRPTRRPQTRPTSPARGMDAALPLELEPVMKTAVSKPSRNVVLKASRKMPDLPALLLTCKPVPGVSVCTPSLATLPRCVAFRSSDAMHLAASGG